MAKGKSTWKYNKLLTARRNYFNLGGTIPMESTDITGKSPELPTTLPSLPPTQGASNPGGLLGAAASDTFNMIGGISNVVGTVGGQLLSQGKESSIGSGLQRVGTMFSSVPVIGNYMSGALNLLGGGVNAVFGSKLNEANIASAKTDIARMNSVKSDASNFDTLSNIMATTVGRAQHGTKFYGKDGWASNKASKLARNLEEQAKIASQRQDLALANNAADLNSDQLSNLESNYAAFGGPMDFGGGAIGYDFMNKYLGIKELAALGQDASLTSLPNSFAEGGGIYIKKANRGKFTDYCGGKVTAECIARGKKSLSPAVRKRATFAANARKWKHAFGGDLLTHGANFDTGVTLIGNGGTHEENPNEGVPMGMDAEGTPNLVEEGEVIFNDYVFSNRLRVPKEVRKKYKLRGTKPLTFAEAATQMSKESEERPNDPISKAGLEDSMMKLMIAQEQVRAKDEKNRFAKGGKIARRYNDGSHLLLDRPIDMSDLSWMEGFAPTDIDVTQTDWWKNEIAPLAGPIDPATTMASIGDFTAYPNTEAVPVETREVFGSPTPRETKTTRSGNGLAPTWMRYVPAFASGIMSITDAAGLTNKPDYSEADMILDATRGASTYSPVGFSPIGNYLGYTPFDREFYINQMNAQAGATRRVIMQNAGLNRGAGMAALLASDYNTQGQLGQLARQAEEYNLAQRQKVEEFNRATDMFNTEGALKADMANQEAMFKVKDAYLKGTLSAAELRQRERQQAAAARSANLSNFINSLGDIGRENFARNMIVSDPSKYYNIGANGEVTYKASFDDLSEAEQDYVRGHASRKSQSKKARGGYLTRKKRR